ncbi:hypothetical protein ATO6_21470 [Oceanicola sp. 22II-s10i]|nr:hypothetical protein ATO6_21470 [Oceanicola sp. 22II-s10i]
MPRVLVLPLLLGAPQAGAVDGFGPVLRGYVETNVLGWLNDPAVISAIHDQNRRHTGITQARIDALEYEWQSQIAAAESPLIDGVTRSAAADVLRLRVAESSGIIAEVFVMDAHGLNVAASGLTSDYWQGDEAKFTETFGAGGGVHVSDVEFDESTQLYLGQVSVPISDPDTGALIGAATIGLNAELLF